jgi:hypothetical protein
MIDIVKEFGLEYVCNTYELSRMVGASHRHLKLKLEVMMEDQNVVAPRAVLRSPLNGQKVQVRKLPPVTFIMLLGRLTRNENAKEMYHRALEGSQLSKDNLIKVTV